jgi:hypothetical protein
MRKYLYRKLREYLDLYVRSGDRIVEIDPKETPAPFEFPNDHLLVLDRIRSDTEDSKAYLRELAEFRPDYVLLNGTHPL